jgi:hypothetical protein
MAIVRDVRQQGKSLVNSVGPDLGLLDATKPLSP